MAPTGLEKHKLKHSTTRSRQKQVKKTEHIRTREEWCHSVLQNSMDAILLTVPDGRILAANPAACRMFGRTEEEICRVGRNGVVEARSPNLKAALKERARRGRWKGELIFKRKDGTRFTGEVTTAVFKDKDGFQKTSMIIRDITERKQIEDTLRASEEHYRLITDNMTDSIVVIDTKLRTTYVSPSVPRALGWSMEELRTLPIEKRLPPYSQKTLQEAVQKLFSKKSLERKDRTVSQTLELEYYRRDGSTFRSEITLTLLRNPKGEPTGILGVGRDVTERKKAEDLLRESEEKFRAVFDQAADLIFIHDTNGKFVDANRKACESIGYAKEELLQLNVADIDPEAIGAGKGNLWEEVTSGKKLTFESHHRRKDGTVYPVEITLGPMKRDKESLVLGIVRDITERKKAEERITKLHSLLTLAKVVDEILLRARRERELFQQTCDSLTKAEFVRFVWVGLVEKDSFEVKPVAHAGFEEGYLSSIKVTWDNSDYGKGPTGTAIKTRKPCVMRDIATDPQYFPWRNEALKRGYTSSIALPLIYKAEEEEEEVIGVLNVYSGLKNAFGDEEVGFLTQIANDIAIGVRSFRLQKDRDRMFNYALDKLCIAGFDGYFKSLNPSWQRTLGWTNEELLSKPYLEFVHPDDRELTIKAARRLVEGKAVITFENRYLCKDGSYRWISWNSYPLVDEKLIFAVARDVTEHKRMEEELKRHSEHLEKLVDERTRGLRESEARYHAIVEVQTELICRFLPDLTLTFVNDAYCRYLNKKREELIGRSLEPFVFYKDREKLRKTIASLNPENPMVSYEERGSWPDGKIRWQEWRDRAIFDEQGRIIEIQSVGRDITERKLMEEALRQSEARYRAVVEDQTELICRQRPDWTLTFVNEAYCRYFGRREDELIGQSFAPFIVEEDREKVKKAVASLTPRNPSTMFEERVITPSGEIRWQQWTNRAIFDEKGTFLELQGVGRDITNLKRLEEELTQRNEDLQTLNASVAQRLTNKIGQINNLSLIRDKLRKTPDISSGLNLILDTALTDLAMDAGAILVFNREKDTADVQAFKSTTEKITLKPSYPPCRVSGCDVLTLDKPLSKMENISCILGTNSVHCAPIHYGKEPYGAFILGSQKALKLDESDLTILNMYAELTSTVFETQSMAIVPVKEKTRAHERKLELEFGGVYLAKNTVEKAFKIFADDVLGGSEGLCITREYPARIRKKYGLEKTPIVWLTEERVDGQITVNSLQDLSVMIGNFLEKAKRSIVLLDGAEYLITNHGFESFIRFLQLNRSRIEEKESILIIPVLEEAVDAKVIRLIERETISLANNL